jgi:hypothetical protein
MAGRYRRSPLSRGRCRRSRRARPSSVACRSAGLMESGRMMSVPSLSRPVQQPSHVNSYLRHPPRAQPIRGGLGGVAGRAFARNRAGVVAVARRNARRKGSDADPSPAIICVTTLFVRQVGRHRSWDTWETRRQHGLKQAQIGPPLSGWVGTVIGHTLLGRRGAVVSYRTLHRYTTTELGFSQRKTRVRVADCARSAIGRVVHVAYQARLSSASRCDAPLGQVGVRQSIRTIRHQGSVT